MENLEKRAKLAELIESTSRHARDLVSDARYFNMCVMDIPSWNGLKNSPSEKAASCYLEDIKILVNLIEMNFSNIRDFMDENY